MHIYNSNHYSSTIKQIINDCLHSAKENPFAIHYVIVDDPKYRCYRERTMRGS